MEKEEEDTKEEVATVSKRYEKWDVYIPQSRP